jgi:small Trp-rich protein
MYFLFLGIALGLMKFLGVGFMLTVSWWVVGAPFICAVVWWTWADRSGFTARKAMERDQARKQARIEKQRRNIGTMGGDKKR